MLKLAGDDAILGHLLKGMEGCVAKLLMELEKLSLISGKDWIIHNSLGFGVMSLEWEGSRSLVADLHSSLIIILGVRVLIIRDNGCWCCNELC